MPFIFYFLLFNLILLSKVGLPLYALERVVACKQMSAFLVVFFSELVHVQFSFFNKLEWFTPCHISVNSFSQGWDQTWEGSFVNHNRLHLFVLWVEVGFLSLKPTLRLVSSQVELEVQLNLVRRVASHSLLNQMIHRTCVSNVVEVDVAKRLCTASTHSPLGQAGHGFKEVWILCCKVELLSLHHFGFKRVPIFNRFFEFRMPLLHIIVKECRRSIVGSMRYLNSVCFIFWSFKSQRGYPRFVKNTNVIFPNNRSWSTSSWSYIVWGWLAFSFRHSSLVSLYFCLRGLWTGHFSSLSKSIVLEI